MTHEEFMASLTFPFPLHEKEGIWAELDPKDGPVAVWRARHEPDGNAYTEVIDKIPEWVKDGESMEKFMEEVHPRNWNAEWEPEEEYEQEEKLENDETESVKNAHAPEKEQDDFIERCAEDVVGYIIDDAPLEYDGHVKTMLHEPKLKDYVNIARISALKQGAKKTTDQEISAIETVNQYRLNDPQTTIKDVVEALSAIERPSVVQTQLLHGMDRVRGGTQWRQGMEWRKKRSHGPEIDNENEGDKAKRLAEMEKRLKEEMAAKFGKKEPLLGAIVLAKINVLTRGASDDERQALEEFDAFRRVGGNARDAAAKMMADRLPDSPVKDALTAAMMKDFQEKTTMPDWDAEPEAWQAFRPQNENERIARLAALQEDVKIGGAIYHVENHPEGEYTVYAEKAEGTDEKPRVVNHKAFGNEGVMVSDAGGWKEGGDWLRDENGKVLRCSLEKACGIIVDIAKQERESVAARPPEPENVNVKAETREGKTEGVER